MRNRDMGLPNFRPEFVDQARKLCQLGATKIELANFFDVTTETIFAWRANHREFSEAMRIGSEAADGCVERSLYQRACGYDRDALRIINGKNGVIRVPCREHIPGDVTAQIKWLANRRPKRWGDNAVHETEPERSAAELRSEIINKLIEWGVLLPDEQMVDADSNASPDEQGDIDDGRGRRDTRSERLRQGTKHLRPRALRNFLKEGGERADQRNPAAPRETSLVSPPKPRGETRTPGDAAT